MAHSLLGENIKNIQLLEFTLKGCAPDAVLSQGIF